MDIKDVARANRRQILQLIQRNDGLSRSQVASRTALAPSTVTEITEKLLRAGILSESEVKRTGRRGRPQVVLRLCPGKSLVVVSDCLDGEVRALLVDATGEVIEARNVDIADSSSFEDYLQATKKGVSAVGRRRWDDVKAITIVGPGIVDPKAGKLLLNTHHDWRDRQLLPPFRRYGKQLFLQNGSRLRALAESWYGASQDAADFLYFHLDAGIGGAIVMHGELAQGPSHGAGEFGHMIVADRGPRCPCGATGCAESLASMRAIVRATRRRSCRTFATAWRLFLDGDARAREAFERALTALTRCILNAAIAIGPTTVLVGGRMVDQTHGAIVDLLQRRISRTGALAGRLDLRRCALDDDRACTLGAVAYALQEMDIEE